MLMLPLLLMERADVVTPKRSNADANMVKQGKESMVSFISFFGVTIFCTNSVRIRNSEGAMIHVAATSY